MTIKDIKLNAHTIIEVSSSKVVRAYVLENLHQLPNDNDINRTCGSPIGVNEQIWPMHEGKKMDHVITLDLDTVPQLKSQFSLGTRAIALFVSCLLDNEAFTAGNKETVLLELTEEDLKLGVVESTKIFEGGDITFENSTFLVHEIDLPAEVFDDAIYDRDEDDPIALLYEQLCECGLAAGRALWLQGEEYQGEIILQFDEGLVDMNLGDAGVMYVFKDTAFWQCH